MHQTIQDDLSQSYHILDAIHNPIFVLDLDKRIIFMNESAKSITSMPYESYLHQPCTLLHTPYCNTKDCCIERFLRGEKGMVQYGPDPHIANRVTVSELKNQEGQRIGYISLSTDVYELIQTQRQLIINEERYKIALQQTRTMLWSFDPYAKTLQRIDTSSKHISSIFPSTTLITHIPESLADQGIIGEHGVKELLRVCDEILQGKKECYCEIEMKAFDQSIHWIRMMSTTVFDHEGNVIEAIGVTKDITKEKQLELSYREEKEVHRIVSSEYISIYEADLTDNKLMNADENWLQELSLQQTAKYDDLHGAMKNLLHPDFSDISLVKDRAYLLHKFHNQEYQFSHEYRKKISGEYHWIRSTTNLFQNQRNQHIIACVSMKDIEEEKRKEEEWKNKAERDLLTGLYNHTTTVTLIHERLEQDQNAHHAFMIMDLDDFKDINDNYGHMFGDQVLQQMASLLQTIFPKDSIIGRLGGDEFMIFIPHISSRASVLTLCETLYHDIEQHSDILSSKTTPVSMGICFYDEIMTFEELYHKADIAMYFGKHNGKNQCSVFETKMLEYTDITSSSMLSHTTVEANIRELIFRVLFTSQTSDFDQTMEHVLKLITLHFKGNHSFIAYFNQQQNNATIVTEWMDDDSYAFTCDTSFYTPDMLMEAKHIYMNSHNQIFFANDYDQHLSPYMKMLLKRTKAKAIVQMHVPLDSTNHIAIHFCDCKNNRKFTREMRETFRTLFEIIGIFLQNHEQNVKLNEYLKTTMTLLNHIGNAIYVVDPINYQLIYINTETQKLFPQANPGIVCHQCFRGSDTPCIDCPIHGLIDHDHPNVVNIYNSIVHQRVRTTANYIDWPDGHRYVLLSCVDITDYKIQGCGN